MINSNDAKYFSIHSVNALKKREYSIIVANIDNTPEKVELAKRLYNIEDWHFEFHFEKINVSPVVNRF